MSQVLRHTLSLWDRLNLIEKDLEILFGIVKPPVAVEPLPVPVFQPPVPPVVIQSSLGDLSVLPVPVVPVAGSTKDKINKIFGL